MAFGHEKLAVDATVRALTVPADVNFAQVKVETAAIRYRLDGTDPATAVGVLVSAGDSFCIYGVDALRNIKMVEATSTDSVINVSYGTANNGIHGVVITGTA
jgi:hypothetical protein|tara:strand:+ start:187 stop:492 length:306 start_codon:yes stop_codon:yes gene_type:complete